MIFVTQKAIKKLVETGCAHDISDAPDIKHRPFNSTIIFHSIGRYGLNGIVLRDNTNGELYAVIGRTNNLFILAY